MMAIVNNLFSYHLARPVDFLRQLLTNNRAKPLLVFGVIALLGLLQGCYSAEFTPTPIQKSALPSHEYVGSETCGQCHSQEYSAWQGSHHQLAMSKASHETVLADFNDVVVTHQDRKAHFFKENNLYFVTTDNAKGQPQTFEVTDTFGVSPLQQYLVTFPRGRKQVLDIAWDARDKSEGGQTWFYVNSDHGKKSINPSLLSHINSNSQPENKQPEKVNEPLHWTSSFYNWNSRCATCHTTGFEKNYDASNDAYNSQYKADNVGCEACHGKGQQHVTWAKGDTEKEQAFSGLTHSMKDNGVWDVINEITLPTTNPERAASTKMRTGPSAATQINACAGCHSRRLQLSQHQAGQSFTDNYLPMLIEQPLYHNDGQIKDEVFVWGSFTQSKMFQAGVVCSNCHDSHTLQLKIEGNGLCTQCHNPTEYDNQQHHQHLPASTGAQCVNCHMPDTTYMNVDKRRDHSFKIPRPAISEQTGAPDACTNCHSQKTQKWAANNMAELFGHNLKPHNYAHAFAQSQTASHKQTNQLLHIANNTVIPDIIRASALTHISASHSNKSVLALKEALNNTSAIIRLGAVRSLSTLPVPVRFDLLKENLNETSLSVRLEMARQLAPLDLIQLKAQEIKYVNKLFSELISTIQYDADTPENQVILANFYVARNQLEKAIKHFQVALFLEPHFENALLNLADLHRSLGDDLKALALLKEVTQHHARSPYGFYALGLLYVRQNSLLKAIDHFKKAIELNKSNSHYVYTYILSLIKSQQKLKAKEVFDDWQKSQGKEDNIESLRNYL